EFTSARNLSNIGLQAAALIIVSLGMTLVILTEGIDLSLGALLGLCGVVMSLLLVSRGVPLPLAIGAALAVGILAGALNGALAVAVLRNGLNLVGLSTEWQVAVVGLVIVSAVALDALRSRA